MVESGVNCHLIDKLNINVATNYNHTSNGGANTPNKGLDFPSLNLAINTSLTEVDYPNLSKISKREPPEDKTKLSLVHFSGWSNAAVGDKDKFYVFGFMVNYSRWIGGRSALTAGKEGVFDYSRKEQINVDSCDARFSQGTALVAHEF